MARTYADEQHGWALAKRGKAAKAIKIAETGDGVPLGTVRDIGVPYQPITAARVAFRAWVDRFMRANRGDNVTVASILDDNLARLARENKTTRTTSVRHDRLKKFFVIGVADVSHELCQQYAQEMDKDGYSAHTIWGDLNSLRSALRSAYQRKKIKEPCHEFVWNVAKPAGRQNQLTPEQFWKWYDAAKSDHIRLFLLIGLLTGQRHEAICQLRWDHVDFERNLIDFRASKRKRQSVLDKGFQKERGIVHIGDTLRTALLTAKQRAVSNYVIEYQGRPVLASGGCSGGCRVAREKAGLPDWVVPHILRHTAATWAEAEGIDIETVAQMTGHRDTRVLAEIYVHRSGKKSKAAVEAVEKRLGAKLRTVK